MKLVVIFITGYSGHPVDKVPLRWRVDPRLRAGTASPVGQFICKLSKQWNWSWFVLPVTAVIPLTKSLFDDELTSAFEQSLRDLLDNLFVSWLRNEIGCDFYYRCQWDILSKLIVISRTDRIWIGLGKVNPLMGNPSKKALLLPLQASKQPFAPSTCSGGSLGPHAGLTISWVAPGNP